jgi:membrane dipeptidase
MSIDRRGFVALTAAMGLAAQARAEAAPDGIIVNALGGLADPNHPADSLVPVVTPRVLADAKASGVTMINCTLGYVSGPGDPFELTVRDIAATDALIRQNGEALLKVWSAADIIRAKREGKVGLLYGVQNCAMLGTDVSRVDLFADLGVRVFQLTYNPANGLGDGSMAPLNRGLTPFGRQVIARLNARRMMVDLSHSGEQTCLEAARASTAPISINHTGCRALTDLPRNKTDAELRLAAERGGFVGIYFMPFLNLSGHATAEDVAAHIDHAVNVCGEDHVGIGTDGTVTGIDDLAAYASDLAKEHERRVAAGIAAKGERADTYPFVADLRGPDQFHKLMGLLKQRGHGQSRIEKIMGRNFVDFGRRVWGG